MEGARVNKLIEARLLFLFSKSTSDDTRDHIKLALGVPKIKQYEKYLFGLLLWGSA